MRILVSNDDGINARGLKVLEAIARQMSDDVWVVAPETQQSASSHSLTLNRPLRLRRLSRRRHAANGTPSDCIYLAFKKLLDDHMPDLVLSGVNEGSNVGEDVTYSGTIAAAMEATLMGVPAIAMSQAFKERGQVKWATAARWGEPVIRGLLNLEWDERVLFNVNFPNSFPDQVIGIRAAHQGEHDHTTSFEERTDPRGLPYYWIGSAPLPEHSGRRGTDLRAIDENYVSVTPIHMNLTHRKSMAELRKIFS